LHDENSTYDLNFLKAAKEACLITGSEIINKTGIPEGNECYEAACELADMGCSLVFADSFGHEDYLIQAARDYPEVQFCHATGTKAHTVYLPNFHNAFAAIYEGRFIGGAIAGMKLNEMISEGKITPEEAKVGYIGAYPYAEVKSGYTAFFLGVRYTCPEAFMEVTFTNSWYDPTLEKEAAIKLINDGCVLISEHADSMGAPTECEANKIPFVFYNGSCADSCPNSYMIGSRINWTPYFTYIINCVKNGESIDTDWVGDFNTGSIVITEINDNVAPAGTWEQVAVITQKFKNETLNVFDTAAWTVNDDHLNAYMADVDTDDNYTPDTNVIENGVFYESLYRSAPYFDIDIDGITILGN
jgi:basic membrane protein A